MAAQIPAVAGQKTVAQYVTEQLAAWGLRTLYGVTGDSILYWMDAIAKQGSIRYINCRLETTAALMASAEAKLTGCLSVCTATSGPGITQLMNGLADAAQDRAPVLAITGQVERKKLGTGAKQEIDQQQLIQPLPVYSAIAADAQALPVQLNQAMRAALSRGGVAHLSVPKDIWPAGVNADLYPLLPKRTTPPPRQSELDVALQLLNGCSRPMILAGRGVQGLEAEVIALAERWEAPVMTTLPARGMISPNHPLYIGGLGQAGSEPASDLLQEADLCLVLGATWWPEDDVPQHIPLVQVDAISENIGSTRPVIAQVTGALADVLPQLLHGIIDQDRSAWRQQVEGRRSLWKMEIEKEAGLNNDPIAPQRVMAAMGRCIEPDAVIGLDVGDHVLWFDRIFQSNLQESLVWGLLRTLGFGLPVAMAAKRAQPDRQVVALVGDGGFGTTLPDLITAVAYQLPLTILLMRNGSFAMEQNRMIQAGLQPLGSDVNNPDFVRLAEAFGAEGIRVETADELEAARGEALASERVWLLEILCDAPMVPHTKL